VLGGGAERLVEELPRVHQHRTALSLRARVNLHAPLWLALLPVVVQAQGQAQAQAQAPVPRPLLLRQPPSLATASPSTQCG
jgi:hypothetical protein